MALLGVGLYVKGSREAAALYRETFGAELGYHVLNEDGSFFHSELNVKGEPLCSVVEAKEPAGGFNPVELGYTFDTREADMLRAIQEGAAFALMDNITEAKKAGAEIRSLRAVGGSTNSDIWMKIKASVTGMPIEIPRQNLGAPGGLLALLASKLGEFASIREACGAILEIERTVEPVNEWVDWYRDQFEIFKAYYRGCKDVFRMSDEARQKYGTEG